MREWIDVNDRLPELTEVVQLGYIADEYNEENPKKWGKFVVDCEIPQSKKFVVAEQKGDDFEEDTGRLMKTGWASNCDNVTHWKDG